MVKKTGLVIALGLDKFIADFTISEIKPDCTVFIVTEKSFQLVSEIIATNNIKDYQFYFVKDIFSTTETIQEFINGFNWLEAQGVNNIVVDATNSITVVEMATYISASLLDLYDDFFGKDIEFKLVYVHTEFTKNEDGIAHEVRGTEKLIELEKPKDSLSFVIAMDAVRAFNNGRYTHAYENFRVLENNTTKDKNILYTSLKNLSLGYDNWDRMDYSSALKNLKKAKELMAKVYDYKFTLVMVNIIEKNIRAVEKLVEEDKVHIIVDLLTNALRLENTKRYDGSVAILYSCLEKITQYELKKYGISSRSPNYSVIDSEVANKFKDSLGFLPPELELKKNVLLLYFLGNEIGVFIHDVIKYKKFVGLIGFRNKSIYAHGITPIKNENYSAFKDKLIMPVIGKFREIEGIKDEVMDSHIHLRINNIVDLLKK